jgi:hypothetical protein
MSHDQADRFVDMCLRGDALADEVDDFVDRWHNSDSQEELAEFLGFTPEEYALWVEKPNSIHFIVHARRNGSPLSSLRNVAQTYQLAARSLSAEDADELTEWLKKTGRIAD